MSMRSVFGSSVALVLSLALISVSYAQAAGPQSADVVLAAALKIARAEHKNVLVHFGASWCTYCKQLDAMLDSPELSKLFHDNYVITHLTIQEHPEKVALENPGAQELADAAGAGGQGIPIYIFFDSAGTRLATSMAMPDGGNIGHPVTPAEISAFDGLLKKTAPRMTAEQRKQVSDYLARQKQ